MTIVLVHGAWLGGWCWDSVVQSLRDAGHAVLAPTLTTAGDPGRAFLSAHVSHVTGLIEADGLSGVVLVGHSYGGMVASGVAARVPERLREVIYLDAFVPEPGEALFDLVDWADRVREAVGARGDGLCPPPPPAAIGIDDTAPADRVAPRLVPFPMAAFAEPHRGAGSTDGSVPRRYVRCTANPDPNLARMAERARASGWPVDGVPTGHTPMVTAPDAVATSILQTVSP